MADAKITALTALTGASLASTDPLAVVDISDTTQDASGTSKKIEAGELFKGVPDGTVSAPALAFAADPDTGVYRVGADNIGIATAGVKMVDVGTSLVTLGNTSKGYVTFDADTDEAAVTTDTTAFSIRPYYAGGITGANADFVALGITTAYAGMFYNGSNANRTWTGVNVAPLIDVGTGDTNGPTLLYIRGMYFKPTMVDQSTNVNSTITNVQAIYAHANTAVTTTTSTGIYSLVQCVLQTVTTGICFDAHTSNTSGTFTTAIGLRVTDIAGGTTKWGLQVGDYSSYHQGKLAIGGTTAPTCGVDIQSTAADTGAIRFAAGGTTPASPTSNTDLKIYWKSSRIIFCFNDAGTVRYKSLLMTGTGTTWSHATVAP